MGLNYILRRVAAEQGLAIRDLTSNGPSRNRAVDLINIAAEEVWESTDLPGCLMELIINVTADSEVAIPSFIGELRAMREKSLMHKFTLNDMRPRYQQEPWKQLWRNWRHKGESATQLEITNSAPPILIIPTPDDTEITIRGATANANDVEDTIVMNAVEVQATQPFTRIDSISKDSRNEFDIQVMDVNSNLLAVLYNNELESRYIIVDVSQYPFGGEGASGERIMELLYKKPFYRMELDSDRFPIPGWDNIIVDKTLQYYNEGQEGKEQRALLYAAKVTKKSAEKVKHKEGGQEHEMQFAENPFYGLTKRPYSRIWRG